MCLMDYYILIFYKVYVVVLLIRHQSMPFGFIPTLFPYRSLQFIPRFFYLISNIRLATTGELGCLLIQVYSASVVNS